MDLPDIRLMRGTILKSDGRREFAVSQRMWDAAETLMYALHGAALEISRGMGVGTRPRISVYAGKMAFAVLAHASGERWTVLKEGAGTLDTRSGLVFVACDYSLDDTTYRLQLDFS